MLEETGSRRVEGTVARPETGEWKDTLATKFLDETALREDDGEDVAKGGEGDEDGQRALGSATKDVPEQRGSYKSAGGDDLLLGNRGKVSDVDEHVQDRDHTDGERSGDLESAHGVLCLGQGVVGVAVTNVTPDDVVKSGHDTISGTSGALKRLGEVVRLLVFGELEMTTKGNPAGDNDDQDDDDLDGAEEVLKTDTPLDRGGMDQEGGSDAGETDSTLVPSVDLNVGGVQDVLAKDDRVAACPAEQHNISSVEAGGEELGLAINEFEVVLLTTVLGDSRTELEIDSGAGEGDEHASYPDKEG